MIKQVWHLEWLTTWDEVWSPQHIKRWAHQLEVAEDPHVFATPTLVRAWWNAAQALRQIEPLFLWATTTGGASIFIPLVLQRHGFKNACLRVLQVAGHAEFDYHDPIGVNVDESGWRTFWGAFRQELQDRWGHRFDRFMINGLRGPLPAGGPEPCERAPYFKIGAMTSADDLLNSLGKSLRGDIRRQLRRLNEHGPISYRVLGAGETETALEWLPEILVQHAERWPESYRLPGFHAALVREALPAGLLHVSELKAGDEVVSRHLGFYYKRRFYWYLPVYNPAYQSYSPGKLQLYHCAVDAIERGAEIFDLLRGLEQYKIQWTDKAAELFTASWQGAAQGAVLRLALAEQIKPALQRLKSFGAKR